MQFRGESCKFAVTYIETKKLVKVMNNTLLDNNSDFRLVTYIRELKDLLFIEPIKICIFLSKGI